MKIYLLYFHYFIGLSSFSQNKYLGISIQDINFENDTEYNWEESISDSIHWQGDDNVNAVNIGVIHGVNQFEFRLGFQYYTKKGSFKDLGFYNNNITFDDRQSTYYHLNITISKLDRIKIFKAISLKYGPAVKLNYQCYFSGTNQFERTSLLNESYSLSYTEINRPNYFTYSLGVQTAILYDLKPFTIALETFNFLTYVSIQTQSHNELKDKEGNLISTSNNERTRESISFNKNMFSLTLLLNF